MGKGWIGVDLDGTLAEYGTFKGHGHIGPPIPAMLARVRAWLAAGEEVRIVTARASSRDPEAFQAIDNWLREHVGQYLQITNAKDYEMRVLYDDRAVAVEKNTGRILGGDHHIHGPGDEVFGFPPCSREGCAFGRPHWHIEDLPKFVIHGAPPVTSCRRHADCLKAPKGQLCCRDPKCTQPDCQVAR